jgi:hypothetical protein
MYPVLGEAVLPPVHRDGWGRRRRDRLDLPEPKVGAVYVFRTEAGFELYAQRHVRPHDPVVVGATEVYLVQTRPQQVAADLDPRPRRRGNVVAEAVFRCRVVDPVAVVAAGLSDLVPALEEHLALDPDIAAMIGTLELDDLAELRRRAEARVRAYCAVAPPEFPGIESALSGVHVIATNEIAVGGLR